MRALATLAILMPVLVLSSAVVAASPTTASSVETPAWRSMLDGARADAAAYAAGLTTPSTGALSVTTDAAVLAASTQWAQTEMQELDALEASVDALPPATSPVEFFQALEVLKETLEQRRREASVASGQAELAAAAGESAAESLARRKSSFHERMAAAVEALRQDMQDAFARLHPDDSERARVRSEAFERLRELSAQEKERARRRADEARREAESESTRLRLEAESARREADEASSDDVRDLALLKAEYAELAALAKEDGARAAQAEAQAREAEEGFQALRAELSARVPVLAALTPGDERVVAARSMWRTRADELAAEAGNLEDECSVLREGVEGLRERRDATREAYDDLAEEQEAHQGDALFRERLSLARRLSRLASRRLDAYRTGIEWRERRRKVLERSRESYLWALEGVEGRPDVLVLGQTPRQWGLFLAGLLLTVVVAWALRGLLRLVLVRWAATSRWTWDHAALDELSVPVRVAAALVGVWLSLCVLTLPERTWTAALTVRRCLQVLVAGFVVWRLLNVVSRVLEPRFKATETTLDDQLLRFVRRALRAVIVLFTGIYLLEAFGWEVGSLLAGLGIGGLAFALAAQDTLANLFGSIVLFLDRPFATGNWVIIAGTEGIVEDIGIRSTQIRTFKDTVVTIPNAVVAKSSAENVHSYRKRRLYFELTLRMDTPVAKVDEAVTRIRTILTDHPMVMDGFFVFVTGITADGIQLMIYSFVATRDWGEWLHHCQTVYLQVLTALEEMGVRLALHARTIELESREPVRVEALQALVRTSEGNLDVLAKA